MKAILLLMHRECWKKILSGQKTVVVQRFAPRNIDYPFLVIGCVLEMGLCGQFQCDYALETNCYNYLADKSLLTAKEISKYANGNSGRHDKNIYGWVVKKEPVVEFNRTLSISDVINKNGGKMVQQEERVTKFMKILQDALEKTKISIAVEAGQKLTLFDTEKNEVVEVEIMVGTEVVKKNGHTSVTTFDYSNV